MSDELLEQNRLGGQSIGDDLGQGCDLDLPVIARAGSRRCSVDDAPSTQGPLMPHGRLELSSTQENEQRRLKLDGPDLIESDCVEEALDSDPLVRRVLIDQDECGVAEAAEQELAVDLSDETGAIEVLSPERYDRPILA